MTDDTNDNTRDVPAVADSALTDAGKSMSENMVSRGEFEKALRQAQRRKDELAAVTKERDELQSQLDSAIKDRDKAVKEVDEIKEAYAKFTDENELLKELESLRSDLKIRDLHDAFNGIEGVEYQDGVTLDDILQAAKLNPAEIDEISPEIVTKAIEAARASKPFLFAAQAPAQGETANTGDVRPEAPAAPTLKAFGAQAVGGGSAPPQPQPDPAKSVDWRNPEAINKFAANSR